MSAVKDRIKEYLRFKGVTNERLYKESGVSVGILSQKNGIAEENIMRFLEYAPDINIEWLFTGKGRMLQNLVNEKCENSIISSGIVMDDHDGYASYIKNLTYKDLYEKKQEEVDHLNKELGKAEQKNADMQKEIDRLRKELQQRL